MGIMRAIAQACRGKLFVKEPVRTNKEPFMLFLILAAVFFVIWLSLVVASYTLGGLAYLLLVLSAAFVIMHFFRRRPTV
jgi:hypothetical protein